MSKLAYSAFLLALCLVRGQSPGAVGGVPVRMVVTAEGRHDAAPPQISREDVIVRQDHERRSVAEWVPLRGDHADLQLWVLVDDSAESNLASQFDDLKKFIRAQPASAQIGVGYMGNGTVETAQPLSADDAGAAKSLRIPLGVAGGAASPYMSLSDLIKKWPDTPVRREVLMITSGIDLYYGPGPENPYLQHAITEAQRAGVIVHSIYYGGIGHLSHDQWQVTWGQSNLAQLCDGTGGEAYWQGFTDPVSLSPFLDDLTRRLNQQYQLTFLAAPGKKSELQPVHLSTEVPYITLVAQSRVWVPAP